MNKLHNKVVCMPAHDRHIYVGVLDASDPDWLHLKQAVNLRYWPADDDRPGLGGICRKGPGPDVVLDPVGHVVIPIGPRMHLISCENARAAWLKRMPASGDDVDPIG